MAWRSFKICKDCKFYRFHTVHESKRYSEERRDCVYYPDLVTGAPKPIPCSLMRKEGQGNCGPNAEFYEAKE